MAKIKLCGFHDNTVPFSDRQTTSLTQASQTTSSTQRQVCRISLSWVGERRCRYWPILILLYTVPGSALDLRANSNEPLHIPGNLGGEAFWNTSLVSEPENQTIFEALRGFH